MSVIEIKRKKSESFEAMFRRFSRRLQQSGKILTLRAGRYFNKPANKNKQKSSALRRLEKGEKREYLLRTGKLKEDDYRRRRRR